MDYDLQVELCVIRSSEAKQSAIGPLHSKYIYIDTHGELKKPRKLVEAPMQIAEKLRQLRN